MNEYGSVEDYSVSITCRDLRHSWERAGDHVLIEQKGQVRHFARTLECVRCECLRIDEYTISGFSLARVRSRYKYPEGYQVPGGLSTEKARFLLFSKMSIGLREAG
jgi:hypothetical protein